MKRRIGSFLAGVLAGGVLLAALPAMSEEEGAMDHSKYGRDMPTPEEMQAGMELWKSLG